MVRMTGFARIAVVLAAAGVSATVQADDLAGLKARLDAIEQENSQLRADLEAMKQSDEHLQGKMTELGSAVEKKADRREEDPLSMSAKWNNGWEASTKDKRFKVHVGGRVQFDTVWLEASNGAFVGTGTTGDQDSVNFRRARLRADGTMFETIDWVCEYDFVNSVNDNPGLPAPAGTAAESSTVIGIPAPTDLWVNFREVPIVGNVRVGNVKEPISFEHLTSSRFLNFMERSYNQDVFYGAFNNGFTPGIMIFDNWADERGTWATGFFKNTTNVFAYGVGDGEYAWTSRVTYLPWYEEEGRYLTHLGVSGSIRDPNNHAVQYRTRGSLRTGPGSLNPVLASTGVFNSTETEYAGLEFVTQIDSLLLQSEYTCAWNQKGIGNGSSAPAGAELGNVFFYGWYAEALYFLTGEHREYEKKTGVFGRVVPHRNFGEQGSLGAWQVGARYNALCLVDSGVDGGRVEDITLGLNWFLNPNMKIQSNYAYTMRDAQNAPGGGDYYGYGMRLAWDF